MTTVDLIKTNKNWRLNSMTNKNVWFKVVIFTILMGLLFSLNSGVMAKQSGEKVSRKKLNENKRIVNDIASSSDTILGEGVHLDHLKPEGDISINWVSGGWNHTHQYLAARAIVILENDKGSTLANIFYNYGTTILENADWPDINERDGGTFKGHFYDPATGLNYLSESSPTAKTRFVYWANLATSYYYSDPQLSMQYLGRAMHYLADLNETHHAQNKIAVVTDHKEFEEWVDERRTDYMTTTTNKYNLDFGSSWSEICGKLADYAAENADDWLFIINPITFREYLFNSWDTVAADTMDWAQQTMSIFLYKFLEAVGEV